MSTTRLTFLYPHLYRTLRASEPRASSTCRSSSSSKRAAAEVRRRGYAAFTPTPEARQSGFAPRHGKGIEPVKAEKARKSVPEATTTTTTTTTTPEKTSDSSAANPKPSGTASEDGAAAETPTATAPTSTTPPPPAGEEQQQEAEEAKAAKQEARDQAKKSGPLEAVLQMGPPEQVAKQHPHMETPPYVHHFDSFSLVKQLGGGGYTEAQSITAMKAIRAILAHNLDVAQESLVSKSDVENETYLFRAACSELSTEVKNNQKLADEEMRQKRTLLQHEVDILTQSLNQELLTLNDNVRGMFNDRKMAVREEQKAGESVIQQINYKISLHLSSDAKSDIEGLRWVLIRRSVIGILFMAVVTLGTLRYGSYVSHEKQKEAERIKKQVELIKKSHGKNDHSSSPDAAEILAAN
ncbi:moz protein represents a chromatin-associated acetyltransferase [Colletotrichum asianum]